MTTITRVLLVGPEGMLGRAWAELLERRGLDYRAVQYPTFDLTDRDAVARLELGGVDVVVNCSGWTDVDGAEEHEEAATAVNGEGVGWLAERCGRAGCTLVHYSTDYVFDGRGTRPYPVDAPVAPLNAYGRSKQLGEARIATSGCQTLLLRTSWLYAPWGNNFVRTMARLGRERDRLRVVADQRGRPTSAEHLARTSLALLERGAQGTLHVTDGGECTWFELAREVVGAVDPTCVVEPCTSAEFPRPAERPSYSVLDLSATEAVVGPMPPWQENLADVLRRL
jgi:dTDP-4-dehydrorhamnose reductase